MTKLLDKCPRCGGEVVEKEVVKLLQGGKNTATLKIQAEICLRCGERFYTPEIVSKFEAIRKKLANKNIEGLTAVGKAFEVAG